MSFIGTPVCPRRVPRNWEALETSLSHVVTIRYELNPQIPYHFAYATDAQPGNAAERLNILCTTKAGKAVHMRSNGDNAAPCANVLADELERVEHEESQKRDSLKVRPIDTLLGSLLSYIYRGLKSLS